MITCVEVEAPKDFPAEPREPAFKVLPKDSMDLIPVTQYHT